MAAFISIISILFIIATLFIAGCKHVEKNGIVNSAKLETIDSMKIKSLSKEQIAEMLFKLETTCEKDEVSFAMCYKIGPQPKFDTFICPDCGERSQMWLDSKEFLETEFLKCVEIAKEIYDETGIKIDVIPVNLCRNCEDAGKETGVTVKIHFENGKIVEQSIKNHSVLSKMRAMLSNFPITCYSVEELIKFFKINRHFFDDTNFQSVELLKILSVDKIEIILPIEGETDKGYKFKTVYEFLEGDKIGKTPLFFIKKVNADNVILEKTTINDKNERSTETITLFPKRTE